MAVVARAPGGASIHAAGTHPGHRAATATSGKRYRERAITPIRRAPSVTHLARTLLCLALLAGPAGAAMTVNKGFAPNSVPAGQPSTLTIVFLNPNPDPATGTAVTDTLPGSVVVAGTPNVATTCGGSVAASAGAGSVALSGGTVPAAVGGAPGQCQVSVDVVSATPGSYINTIPAGVVVSSEGSNSQAAQATLVVSSLASVTGSKAFVPANLHGGGSASTLTITLANPNGIALTGATWGDTFPAGLALATPANATTTCAGTLIAADAGTSINVSGGTIPANGSCSVTASVIASAPNTPFNNTRTNAIAAGALTTAQGVTNAAISANVMVQTAASMTQAFAPTAISSAANSTLTITVHNFNATALSGITFTDTLPGSMVVASPANASTTCGGTLTAVTGSNTVGITGGAVGAAPAGIGNTNCTIVVAVTATNATANPVTLVNTIPAGSFGSVGYAAASANLVVNPSSTISGTKSFPGGTWQTGQQTPTITLSNASASPATITSIVDDLTTMGTGFTVRAVPGGTCGVTMTSAIGATLFTATGGTIPANGSCTITLPIAYAANAQTGNRTNTIAANAVQTSQGNNAVAFGGVNTVSAALTATKAWNPATIAAGGVSRATVTLTRGAGAASLSGIVFTDTLPAGHSVASPANAATTCAGTVTAVPGSASFSLAGGSLPVAGGSCTVQVDVRAPASAGSAINSLPGGTITTAEGAQTGDVSATLTRVATSVTVNQSFSPTTVSVGGVAQLAIQIRNNNANALVLTGVALTDVLPAGMSLASPAALAFTGGGGAASCTAGSLTGSGGQIVLGNASIPVNAICTLTANVQASAAGNLINVLPAGVVASAQSVTNGAPAVATLASTGVASLVITNSNGVSAVTPGAATTYTVTVSNAGPNDVVGLTLADAPPPGVTFGSWTCTATAGSTCTASGSGAVGDTVSVQNGGTLTYTIAAQIDAAVTGSITTTAALAVPGSVVDDQPTTASDTDAVVPRTGLGAAITDGTATYTPGGTGVYTITVSNGGPSDALGVDINDALPAGVTLNGAVTCAALAGAVCGSVSAGAGATSFSMTGAVVRAAAGSSVVLSVPVAFAPGMAAPSIVNTMVAANASSGDSASAADTDSRAAAVTLVASLSDGALTYAPGLSGTYIATIVNGGPSAALDVTLADALPSGVVLAAPATCSASAGSSCGTLTGGAGAAAAGAVGGSIAPGGVLTFTLPVQFGASLAVPDLVDTLVASDAASGATASASDTDTRSAQVTLAARLTDGSASYTPGGTARYVLTLGNAGPSDALDVTVTDALPPGVALSAAATCVATGNAACGSVAGIAGDVAVAVAGARVGTAPGDGLVLIMPVAFASSLALDPLIQIADVTEAGTGESASASDSDARSSSVSLAVVKSDGSTSYQPGGSAVYTIAVTNGGISDALDVAIGDTLPAGVTLAQPATCSVTGNAACGTLTGAAGASSLAVGGARVAAGAGNAVILTLPVAFAAALAADPLVNTANAVDGPSGASGSGSDSNARRAGVTLAVATSDGQAAYTPGGSGTYVVTVSNTGASDALDVAVADDLPAGVTLRGAATCAASGNAACGALSGNDGEVRMAAAGARIGAGAGNAVVYTVPVRFSPSLVDDPLVNTATATDAASGASGSAGDTDARIAQASLSATLSDGSATFTPGGSATYTLVVGNAGPSDATAVAIVDALPAGVVLAAPVVCTATGNAACGTLTGTTGQNGFSAAASFIGAQPGSTLTFALPVAFAPDLAADPLVHAVALSDAASGASANASDSDARSAAVSLIVAVSDGASTYGPGTTATYTVTVGNAGVSDAVNVTVADVLPPGVVLTDAVTCVAAGTSGCGTVSGAAGAAAFGVTGARIAPGAGSGLVLSAPVAFAASLSVDPLVDLATAIDAASGASGSATDSDALLRQVGLRITVSDGAAAYVPGGTGTYVIDVVNTGTADARGVTVLDLLPPGVTLHAPVTCVAMGSAACGTIVASDGSVSVTGAVLPAGPGNALSYLVPVVFAPGLTANPLVNTVSANAPGATAAASDSNARTAASAATPVPVNDARVLAALIAAIALIAGAVARPRRRRSR